MHAPLVFLKDGWISSGEIKIAYTMEKLLYLEYKIEVK